MCSLTSLVLVIEVTDSSENSIHDAIYIFFKICVVDNADFYPLLKDFNFLCECASSHK